MAQTLSFGSGAGSIGGSTSFTPAPDQKLANENFLRKFFVHFRTAVPT